jgi:phage replication-related protein YjqB (UPF0714/DUF867 family)
MFMPKQKKYKFSDFFQKGEIHPRYQDRIKEHAEKKGPISVFAVHGGKIDAYTDQIAEYVAANTQASKYIFESKGEKKGRFEDKSHHVTSTKITPTHSQKLSDIMNHSETGISIHGHYKKGEHQRTIYVGGDNEDLRNQVGERLQDRLGDLYKVVYDPINIPKDVRGTSKDKSKPYNFINKIGEQGGVQVELPEELRKNEEHRKLVGDTLVEVVNGLSQDIQYQPNQQESSKGKTIRYKTKEQQQYQAAA